MVLVPVVMRGGLAVSSTWSGSALPIVTVTDDDVCVAETADAPVTDIADANPSGAGGGATATAVVVGEPVTSPPETAVTVAVPDRLSETRLTRTTPSLVLPCSSTCPRSVKNCTTVPSSAGWPVALSTRPEMTDTSP